MENRLSIWKTVYREKDYLAGSKSSLPLVSEAKPAAVSRNRHHNTWVMWRSFNDPIFVHVSAIDR